MTTHFPPDAVFLGNPSRLVAAYPPAVRTKISSQVNILGPDISGENWQANATELRQAEVILSTWGMPALTAEFLAATPNLKSVFYAAGSVKCFATDEAYARGVLIFSARKTNAVPVAEYAAAVAVLSLKQFWAFSRAAREGNSWSRTIPVAGTYRSTIGLVSLGATGRLTAEKLSRLECDLVAFDPYVQPESVRDLGVKMVSLEDLFRLSDVISIHAPLLPETRGLIDARLLRLMKSGATLINTARGAVIAQHELCEILKKRSDITAVLDVTDPEPPDLDSQLFRLPNVVTTPHISGSMDQEIGRMGEHMADELTQYLLKRPLTHQVTQELLPQLA